MISFNVAAETAAVGEDEAVVEVPIGDQVFLARRPTVAQTALLNAAFSKGDLGMVFRLIEGIISIEARELIEALVWARRLDFGDLVGGGTEMNPDQGLLDGIIAEFAGPTRPSTASSRSQSAGGRKSQGRSPGQGSTRSRSASTGS